MKQMLEYWYDALNSTLGVVIRTTDVNTTKRQLYAARASCEDEDLKSLGLHISPSAPDEIWIVKKSLKDVET